MTNSSPAGVRRRTLLAGAAAVGATGALVACGSSGGSGSAASSGPVTLAAADVPVGGGKIVPDGPVVVTQPRAGVFRAFSAVCTHQGCTVGTVDATRIICPCHGSTFSTSDGSVLNGPATSPLPAKTVTRSGTTLTVT